MTEWKINRQCEQCGQMFAVIPSRVKHGRGRHCSPSCQYAARKAKPKPGSVAFTCIGCGNEFSRHKSVIERSKGSGKYCTRACRDVHWRGDKNPNWQNGNGVYKRGPHWQSTRRRVLSRDGNCCVECGSADSLHVHHVTPFRMFDDVEWANRDDNLVTLCAPCHRSIEAKHKWIRFETGCLRINAKGAFWQLVKERGIP